MKAAFKASQPASLFVIFFIYTVLISALIQLIILPHIFPKWHAGGGLLISSLDSRNFHRNAIGLSEKIRANGWSSWELRPKDQAPTGIAAIFYAIFGPKLWALIPLNAAVHAASCLLLVFIINSITADFRISIISSLPFLLFPSAAIWYSQLHKDGFFIFGFYLYLFGWILFTKEDNLCNLKGLLRITSFIISGSFMIWVVRPYMMKVIFYFLIALIGSLAIYYLIGFSRGKFSKKLVLKQFLCIFMIAFFTFIFTREKPYLFSASSFKQSAKFPVGGDYIYKPSKNNDIKRHTDYQNPVSPFVNGTISQAAVASKARQRIVFPQGFLNKLYIEFIAFQERIKIRFDRFIAEIGGRRHGFMTTAGKSNIDENIGIETPGKLLVYLPRALQIAFLAPFPVHWFRSGSFESNTLMIKITALEMLITYFFLCFLPLAFWLWRKRISTWVTVYFCLCMLLSYAILVCNIGTLYRLRYGFLMVFVGLGVSGAVQSLRNIHFHKTTNT